MCRKLLLSKISQLGSGKSGKSKMNRGIVCAYPLIRGTKYFDDNWYYSGTGERKLTHIMDFVDSALFLKDKGLA